MTSLAAKDAEIAKLKEELRISRISRISPHHNGSLMISIEAVHHNQAFRCVQVISQYTSMSNANNIVRELSEQTFRSLMDIIEKETP